MLNPSFFKITQKMNENPVYWNIKSFLFEEFKLNSTQNSKSEETFLKSLRKTDAEKKLIALIKEVSTLNKNFMTSYLSDDPIANVNEYKKKWFEFLKVQYVHLVQNYYVLSSESKDETIYFYDDQTILNFITKMQNPHMTTKTLQSENYMIKLENKNIDVEAFWEKNSAFEKMDEEKEKLIEKLLERNVLDNCSYKIY